jgi:Protein of unknown function DUF115
VNENPSVVAIEDPKFIQSTKFRIASRFIGRRGAEVLRNGVEASRYHAHKSLTHDGRANTEKIKRFHNFHRGERCVIIGNGPSLKNTDMSLLKNIPTFGLNRIYLMFEELGFNTTYLAVVNNYVMEQCASDFQSIGVPAFSSLRNRSIIDPAPNFTYVRTLEKPQFSKRLSRGAWEGMTVTYFAMQLAYHMGFERVILVGVDHKFAVDGKPNQLVESTGADHSHFDPKYFGRGFKWQLPDLEKSEFAYRLAHQSYKEAGRSIVDATVDGALNVFPKVDLATELA